MLKRLLARAYAKIQYWRLRRWRKHLTTCECQPWWDDAKLPSQK